MGVLQGVAVAAVMTIGALATGASATTVQTGATSFWVLGDSLSDPGNVFAATRGATPPSPPYFEGRFSNGPVWSERLSGALRAQGRATGNVAFGGARAVTDTDAVPDLAAQVQIIAPAIRDRGGARPVAALWFGTNDLFGASERPGKVARTAAAAVTQGARSLAGAGVRDFVIFNLPDLGDTPRYALFDPAAAKAATRSSRQFNATLDEGIAGLRGEGLNVKRIDIASVFDDLQANPGRYGVKDAVLPCLFPSAAAAQAFGQSQACGAETAGDRAFFDSVHPNATVHREIGNLAEAAIAPIPLPASSFLLGGALLALIGFRGRRLSGQTRPRSCV